MKHLDIKIYGKVQGVFYRLSAQKEAEKLGIHGYVENMEDGVVEIKAEGYEEKLDELLAWCRKGPLMSRVAKVEYEKSDEIEDYKNFKILREK
jgi:acylphosphatase